MQESVLTVLWSWQEQETTVNIARTSDFTTFPAQFPNQSGLVKNANLWMLVMVEQHLDLPRLRHLCLSI